jgi:hypothetical protein
MARGDPWFPWWRPGAALKEPGPEELSALNQYTTILLKFDDKGPDAR